MLVIQPTSPVARGPFTPENVRIRSRNPGGKHQICGKMDTPTLPHVPLDAVRLQILEVRHDPVPRGEVGEVVRDRAGLEGHRAFQLSLWFYRGRNAMLGER